MMTFAILETEFVDEDGDSVVTERQTVIETDGTVAATPVNQKRPERDANSERATVHQPATDVAPVISTADVEVGDSGPTIIVEDVTPQDFVRYAGASGDFNPIHYDEQYARALGNPSVFGQGMLTAGYAAHLATDWFGLETIQQFRTRFTARVWPGDTLTVSGNVTAVDAPDVSTELTATRQTGETVLVGDITASVSNRP